MSPRIGISGWQYAAWRGEFYPDGLPRNRELEYAARHFNSIEINGSFYSLQRPERYARWYREVPEDFVFAVKGSRYITHMRRLRDVDTALANFLASGVFELEQKLGPLLWQLPSTFKYDRGRLEVFFDALPRDGAQASKLARKHDERVAGRVRLTTAPERALRHALEVRHASFVQPELIELLREQEIALVVSDGAGRWPLLEDLTADFVYARLHGGEKLYESGYGEDALEAWTRRIRAWLGGRRAKDAVTASTRPAPRRGRRDVFVYFDNDVKVRAPFDAMRLAEKLGARPGA